MEILMLLLVILTVGTLCIACFFIGAKVGQTVYNGEEVKIPSVNPLQAVRERQEHKKADKEHDRIEAIMRNIENYDGTAKGQEDIPKG